MKIGIDLDGVVIDSETTFRTYEETARDVDNLRNTVYEELLAGKMYTTTTLEEEAKRLSELISFIQNRINERNEFTNDYIKITNRENLLPVCGDFHDSQDLFGIKQELVKYKLYDKIKYIKFYTSGRVELMLKNNLLVKMPQKDWKTAMLKFLKMDSEYALSTGQKKIKYIDLRLNDKVYVKEL